MFSELRGAVVRDFLAGRILTQVLGFSSEEIRDLLERHALGFLDVEENEEIIQDIQGTEDQESPGCGPFHKSWGDVDNGSIGDVVEANCKRNCRLLLGHGEDFCRIDPWDGPPRKLKANTVDHDGGHGDDAWPVELQSQAGQNQGRAHDGRGRQQLTAPAAVLGVHEKQPGDAAEDHDAVENRVEHDWAVNAALFEQRGRVAKEGVHARGLLANGEAAGNEHALAKVALFKQPQEADVLDVHLIFDLLHDLICLRRHIASADALQVPCAGRIGLGLGILVQHLLHDEAWRLGNEEAAQGEHSAGQPWKQHTRVPVLV
mmetsp:Transcript_38948/g.93118  ORF Transcript_38948/g.93118 Transcript_38948/m.93118 type:complete len:317 (+) Transcript_38948:149-1099(+)